MVLEGLEKAEPADAAAIADAADAEPLIFPGLKAMLLVISKY